MATERSDRAVALEPDPDAKELADRLVDDMELQARIIEETLNSDDESGVVLESGRTVCGVDEDARPLEPYDRYEDAVDLRGCRSSQTGIYHTHTTPHELRQPQHSLPDYANVVFGNADASVVSGTKTSSVLVAASDPEEMRREYANAIGLDADSVHDVAEAVQSGMIPDPSAARDAVRSALGDLVYDVDTPHPDLDGDVDTVQTPMASDVDVDAVDPARLVECAFIAAPDPEYDAQTVDQQEARGVRDDDDITVDIHVSEEDSNNTGDEPILRLRTCNVLRKQGRLGGRKLIQALSGADATDIVIGTFIGDLSSNAIQRVLYGK